MAADAEGNRRLLAIVTRSEPFDEAPLPAALADAVIKNTAFRRALRTPRDGEWETRVQQVAMALEPGENIDWEVHEDVTQIFIVMSGSGTLLRGRPRDRLANDRAAAESVTINEGSVWVIEAGTWHDVVAVRALKLLTLYTPPEHHYGTLDVTKPAPKR